MSSEPYANLLASSLPPRQLVEQALHQLEADFRERALIALADWEQQARVFAPGLVLAVGALRRPSWGHWNGLIQDLRKARIAVLRNGASEQREAVQRAPSFLRILDLLDEPLDADLVERLQPLAQMTRTPIRKRATLGQVLEQPITLRNRLVHSNPGEGWCGQAAEALRPLLEYHARQPAGRFRGEALSRPRPWFLVEAAEDGSEQVWAFNGLHDDWSAEYVSRDRRMRLEVDAVSTEIQLALQRLRGESQVQEEDLQRLRDSLVRQAPEEFKGVLLGDLLVGRPVGAGGFARVHRGQQLSTGRRVAVKILHDALSEEAPRFREEARYLGQLSHPHIVRVFGQGRAVWRAPKDNLVAGEPWFADFKRSRNVKTYMVLEWVEGRTLDETARAVCAAEAWRGLNPAQRQAALAAARPEAALPPDAAPAVTRAVELLAAETRPGEPPEAAAERLRASRPDPAVLCEWFAQAAEALAAVHAAGLVHRDVKPGNLMVADDGAVKLMDFGIARSQAEDLALRTRTRELLGTPAYMSPEQQSAHGACDAEAVGPASDIYSLCATFYQLFTGRLYEGGRAPNRRGLPREAAAHLLGGLEREVKDRPRADVLARDLRRIRRHEPTVYRPPPWWRRLMLFYRRQRTPMNLAATFLLAAVLGVAFYIYAIRSEQGRTAAQRDLAENRLDFATNTVDEMLVQVSDKDLVRSPLMEQARAKLLDKAKEFYTKLLADRSEEPRSRLLIGRTQRKLGRILEALGQHDEASDALKESIAFLERLAGEFPDKPLYREELAYAVFISGEVHRDRDELPEAEAAFRRAMGLRQQLVRDEPDKPGHQSALAADHEQIAALLARTGRYDGADHERTEALALLDRLLTDHPPGQYPPAQTRGWREERGDLLRAIANRLDDQNRMTEAETNFQAALTALRELVAEAPTSPDYSYDLAVTLSDLGVMLDRIDQRKRSDEAFSEAYWIYEDLLTRFPSTPKYRLAASTSASNLGMFYARQGHLKMAETLAQQAVGITEWMVETFPDTPAFQQALADHNDRLASVLEDEGKTAEADKVRTQNHEARLKLAATHPGQPLYAAALADSHIEQGRRASKARRDDEALGEYQKAFDLLNDLAARFPQQPSYREQQAYLYRLRGLVLARRQDDAGAMKDFQAGASTAQQLEKDHPELGSAWDALAEAHAALGRFFADRKRRDEAEKEYLQVVEIRTRELERPQKGSEVRGRLAAAHAALGDLYLDFDQLDRAEQSHKEALALRTKLAEDFPEDPEWKYLGAASRVQLGSAYRAARRWKEAQGELSAGRDALSRLVEDLPESPRYRIDLAKTHAKLGELLVASDHAAEAEPEYAKAVDGFAALVKESPDDPEYHLDLAIQRRLLAVQLNELGRNTEAIPVIRQAVKDMEDLYSRDKTDARYRDELARSSRQLGRMSGAAERDEAVSCFRRAAELEEGLAKQFPDAPAYRREWAWACQSLGEWLQGGKDFEGAERAYRQAVDLRKELTAAKSGRPGDRADLGNVYLDLGWLLYNHPKRWKEAEAVFRAAQPLYEQLAAEEPRNPYHPYNLARVFNNLGVFYVYSKRQADARETHAQARKLREKLWADHPKDLDYGRELLQTYDNLVDMDLAFPPADPAPSYGRVLGLLRQLREAFPSESDLPATHAQRAADFADWLRSRNRNAEALEQYAVAQRIGRKLVADHPDQAVYRVRMAYAVTAAAALRKDSAPKEAADGYREAIELYRVLVEKDPKNAQYRRDLATLYSWLAWFLSGPADFDEAVLTLQRQVDLCDGLATEEPKSLPARLAVLEGRYDLAKRLNQGDQRPRALEVCRRNQELADRLVADFPEEGAAHDQKATALAALAFLLMDDDKAEEALPLAQQALSAREQALKLDPKDEDYREQARGNYRVLAEVFVRLKRFAEAATLVEHFSERFPDPAGAKQEAAYYLARCAAGSKADEAERYAKRAVGLLQEAAKVGPLDRGRLRKEPAFDVLRGRADFKELIEGPNKPIDPSK